VSVSRRWVAASIRSARSLLPPPVEQMGQVFQGQLPELLQVAAGKVVLQRSFGPVEWVDLSSPESLLEVLGRQVHVHYLVGLLENVVGHAFLLPNPGEPLDHVVKTLQVLDVERADDVDSAPEQFVDILVPLRVLAAWGIGVGQFVHQGDGRTTSQDGVHVHFFEHDTAILDLPTGNLFEPLQKGRRLRTAMGFDHSDDDVHPLLLEPLTLLEHLVGFADARCEAQVDLQPASLLMADEGQELLGPATSLVRRAHRDSSPDS
jgi:hypothetical protein